MRKMTLPKSKNLSFLKKSIVIFLISNRKKRKSQETSEEDQKLKEDADLILYHVYFKNF